MFYVVHFINTQRLYTIAYQHNGKLGLHARFFKFCFKWQSPSLIVIRYDITLPLVTFPFTFPIKQYNCSIELIFLSLTDKLYYVFHNVAHLIKVNSFVKVDSIHGPVTIAKKKQKKYQYSSKTCILWYVFRTFSSCVRLHETAVFFFNVNVASAISRYSDVRFVKITPVSNIVLLETLRVMSQ